MIKGFQEVAIKIKKNGFSWFFKRLALEFRSPYYSISKKLVSSLAKIKFFNIVSSSNLHKSKSDVLNVFYDLNIEPNTFGDFAQFLVDAEIYGNQHNRKNLFLWIIPKEIKVQEDSDGYTKIIGEHNWTWRITNMLVPMISLHPSYVGHAVLSKGAPINPIANNDLRYPDGFSDSFRPRLPNFFVRREIYKNNFFRGLSAPTQGKRHISDWVQSLGSKKKIISITIRDYGFDPSRNCNVPEWLKFADWLENKNYKPVFVPDAGSPWALDSSLKHHLNFKDACWNVPLRMALYEECALNYFYSNGCAHIAIFNKNVASIVMMPILTESIVSNEANALHDPKIDPRRLAFAEPNQWWSNEIDSFNNLKKDFLEYEKLYL